MFVPRQLACNLPSPGMAPRGSLRVVPGSPPIPRPAEHVSHQRWASAVLSQREASVSWLPVRPPYQRVPTADLPQGSRARSVRPVPR